jgi:hypothetical protein
VREHVAQARDSPPRDFIIALAHLGWDSLAGFSKDLEVPQHGVVRFGIRGHAARSIPSVYWVIRRQASIMSST